MECDTKVYTLFSELSSLILNDTVIQDCVDEVEEEQIILHQQEIEEV